MRQLIHAKYNYVPYARLCDKLSQQTVDAMIEYNIFHLHPCPLFSFDFETAAPSEYPIVTPHLPCDIMLMRGVLREPYSETDHELLIIS